jgi:raffinose/stachyose/melibiose transport system permease protein
MKINTKAIRWNRVVSQLVKQALALLVCSIMLIPLALVILNSFKSQSESFAMNFNWPKIFHFENYLSVIDKGKIVPTLINSLIYSSATVLISVPLSAMAAFVLARNRTKLNNAIYFFLVLGLTLSVNHIALMKIMQLTHLINTRFGLSLIYSALQIPFNVFLYYGFILTVPKELDEAGIIDGCSPFKLFSSIVLPLLRPVSVTIIILCTLNTWNDFIYPLYYMNSSDKWPITIGVYQFFGRYQVSWNLVCADVVLMSLPVIMLYILGQKFIVSGMTAGSVKS